MNESINVAQLLEQMEEWSNVFDYVGEQPFYLYTDTGEMFYTIVPVKGCMFITPFFTIKKIDKENRCAILHVLVPFPFKKRKNDADYLRCVKKLLRTNVTVVIDFSCLCGIATLCVPICDYVSVSECIKEQFSLPYVAQINSSVIWNSLEKQIDNTATLVISYLKGSDEYVDVIIQIEGKTKEITIRKGRAMAITVKNIRSLQIRSVTGKAYGTVDIQLNRRKVKEISFL